MVLMILTRAAASATLVAVLCLVATGAVWAMRAAEERRVTGREAQAPAQERTPVEVVHGWDERRAAAWAAGDAEALARLYVPGARVGRADAAMLEAYLARDLRVEGLDTQLLEVEEVRTDEHEMVVRVTDRVHAGTVVGPGMRRALPRDAVSVRRLTLRLHEGSWRVARVVESARETG